MKTTYGTNQGYLFPFLLEVGYSLSAEFDFSCPV